MNLGQIKNWRASFVVEYINSRYPILKSNLAKMCESMVQSNLECWIVFVDKMISLVRQTYTAYTILTLSKRLEIKVFEIKSNYAALYIYIVSLPL